MVAHLIGSGVGVVGGALEQRSSIGEQKNLRSFPFKCHSLSSCRSNAEGSTKATRTRSVLFGKATFEMKGWTGKVLSIWDHKTLQTKWIRCNDRHFLVRFQNFGLTSASSRFLAILWDETGARLSIIIMISAFTAQGQLRPCCAAPWEDCQGLSNMCQKSPAHGTVTHICRV